MRLRNVMQKIVTLGTGLILILIAIFIVLVVQEYYWEDEYNRMKQEFAEATENIQEEIERSDQINEKFRQTVRKRERETRLYHMPLSTAFKEGRCPDFLLALDHGETLTIPESLLQADLYMRGSCAEQNYAKAFAIYQKKLSEIFEHNIHKEDNSLSLLKEYYAHISHIKFRLSTLYWRGQGVLQDKQKAQELSKQAALIWPIWYADVSHRPLDIDLGPPNIWNMSDADILENVTFHETGPWDMPESLTQQIDWLKNIHKEGGKTYLEIGLHLLNGTGGYEQDPLLAYEWIYIASHYFDYGPAHYPRAMLLGDQEFYEKKREFPVASSEFNKFWKFTTIKNMAYGLLRRAVEAGDIRADKEILRIYQNAPEDIEKQMNIYFWMLRLYQQNDPDITKADLANIRKNLSEFGINYTESNVKEDLFPIPSLRPPN